LTDSNETREPFSLRSRRWTLLLLLLILTAGGAVRLLYLREATQIPSFAAPAVDAAFHDYWARGLATGDWTPPGHHDDPGISAAPYFRPPGYPFFLAAVYALFGDGYLAPRIVQMGLGLACALLAFLICARSYGWATGLICAAAVSGYWTLVYFEAELQATTLFVFLLLASVLFALCWSERGRPALALASGLFCGVAALVRPNAILVLLALALWAVWTGRRRSPRLPYLAGALTILLGGLLAVLPATVRNWIVAEDLVPISSNAGINLYIGNNPDANGLVSVELADLGSFRSCFDWPAIVDALERETGRSMRPSEVSSYFAGRAYRFAITEPDRFLALTARKALLFWGPREVSHNKELHFERRASAVLSRLPGNFALVLATGLLGLGLLLFDRFRPPAGISRVDVDEGNRRWESAMLAVAVVIAYFLSVLPFFAAARYRVPIIPFLMLLGAFAVHRLAVMIGRRRWRAAITLVVVLLALYGVTTRAPADYEPSEARWHFDRATDFARIGDGDQAVRLYREALALDPAYYEAHYNLAHELNARGRVDEAIEHWRSALRIYSGAAPAHYNLALAYRETGDIERAIHHMRQALATRPDSLNDRLQLAELLLSAGRIERATELYEEVLARQPERPEALRNLAWILAAHPDPDLRDPGRAIALAERAASGGGARSPSVFDALAAAYAAAGRYDEATETALRAEELARAAGNERLAAAIRSRLAEYRRSATR